MDIEDLSLKLKERTVKEGFAVSGIASIPGSSRINLRTEAKNPKGVVGANLRGRKERERFVQFQGLKTSISLYM